MLVVTCHHSLLQLKQRRRVVVRGRAGRVAVLRHQRFRLLLLLNAFAVAVVDFVTAAASMHYCDAIFRACCHGPQIASICCRRRLAQQRLLRLRLLSCWGGRGGGCGPYLPTSRHRRRRRKALVESCHSRWARRLLLLPLRWCPPVALPRRDPCCRRCRVCILRGHRGDTTGISLLRLIVHIVAQVCRRLHHHYQMLLLFI